MAEQNVISTATLQREFDAENEFRKQRILTLSHAITVLEGNINEHLAREEAMKQGIAAICEERDNALEQVKELQNEIQFLRDEKSRVVVETEVVDCDAPEAEPAVHREAVEATAESDDPGFPRITG